MFTQENRSFTRTWLKPAAAALAIATAAVSFSQAAVARETPAVSYPAYQGPKKTIAVTKFDAVGSFVGRYGGWDIGGGLAAMLVTELARTNRFVVVERAELDTLLREKQMALSGVTQSGGEGRLHGAQTFIQASVTSFDEQEKGGGFSLGLNLPGIGNGGAGLRQATGHVAIDLRLIDGDTGAIIATSHVEKKLRSSSVALQGQVRNINFGADQFQQTSLGAASRQAIEQAVAQIIAGMERVPFQALVARTEGSRVYLNAGRNANVVPGSLMRVIRTVDTVTDPQTGEVLGAQRQTVAELVIEQVEDRYSIGRLTGSGYPVQRSDVAQLVSQ